MFQNVSEHCENCFKCQTVLKHLETIPDSRMTLFCLNGLFALESVWILSPFICTVPASVETRGGHAGYELRSLKSTQRRRRNFDPSVAECFTVFFFFYGIAIDDTYNTISNMLKHPQPRLSVMYSFVGNSSHFQMVEGLSTWRVE